MSDQASTESNGATSFTASETKLLMSILKNLRGDIASDWETVAVENNYKDASIAKTRWSQIRRKKIQTAPAGGIDKKLTNKKTPDKPKKVKTESDGDNGAEAGTPSKAKAVKKSDVKVEEEPDNDNKVDETDESIVEAGAEAGAES